MTGGERRSPRMGTGSYHTESVHLIGGASTREVAAVLYVGASGASCWFNRRLVRGPMVGWLDLWAQRQVKTGWSVKGLRGSDLPPELND